MTSSTRLAQSVAALCRLKPKYMGTEISVIIPTKNRPNDLERTVKSLCRQTVKVAELIIVDQSESDVGQELIRPLLAEWRVNLIYRRDPSLSGLAAARNRAMALATADIVLFLDDDVELECDFIEQLLTAYRDHRDATGVSGIITNYVRPRGWFRVWRRCFLRGPFDDQRQQIYWNAEQLRNSGPVAVPYFGGGLMSFRVSAIAGLRFDEALHGVADGEDIEFCLRLPDPVLFINPRSRLAHYHSQSERLRDHWSRRGIRGQWFLYLKHWNHGLRNRVYAAWLIVGYILLISFAACRQRSHAPLRAFMTGWQEAQSAFLRCRTDSSRGGAIDGCRSVPAQAKSVAPTPTCYQEGPVRPAAGPVGRRCPR